MIITIIMQLPAVGENQSLKQQGAGGIRVQGRQHWGGPVVPPAMSPWCCSTSGSSPKKFGQEGRLREGRNGLLLPWQLARSSVAFKGFFLSWGLWAKDTSRLQLYICQFDQQMGERAIKLQRLSPSPFNPARRAHVISPPGALIGF